MICSHRKSWFNDCVIFADVQTVKSLVEEMESKGSEDEAEEDEQIQQGIGKRVIGEPENFLVRSGVFSLLCMESIETKMVTRFKPSS